MHKMWFLWGLSDNQIRTINGRVIFKKNEKEKKVAAKSRVAASTSEQLKARLPGRSVVDDDNRYL